MRNKLLPILSGSLREVLISISQKTDDPIVKELITVDTLVNDYNNVFYGIGDVLGDSIVNMLIDPLITDEVRMITVRHGEFEVSFLPKGREPEYGPHNTWARTNRQTGKPARIFQKLLKKEFKTRDWEIFTNLFKAELCACTNFELVSGEAIRYWYLDEHYYKCDGTLGNSCMRYCHAQEYFDIYVDHAQMLITTKDGRLTGRALVWKIGDITLLDRIYTCFDYLENCFIDYAKEQKWWIRDDNSLLNTGDDQCWLTPDDDYQTPNHKQFTLHLNKTYCYFPYMDSFRYYDGGETISTCSGGYICALDCTDGEYRGDSMVCESCGNTFYCYDGDTPEELHYSEWADAYYCDDCCWYSDGLDDYVPNSERPIYVNTRFNELLYPLSYVEEYLINQPVEGNTCGGEFVMIDDTYYTTDCQKITFNEETKQYEIRSSSS